MAMANAETDTLPVSSEATAPIKPGTRKVTVGALAGALVTIIFAILQSNGLTIPNEVFGAASTVATAFLAYMTTESFG